MRLRKLLAAIVLAWLGLTGVMAEASFVHSDDGCAIEDALQRLPAPARIHRSRGP
jgi:hypothetical protein